MLKTLLPFRLILHWTTLDLRGLNRFRLIEDSRTQPFRGESNPLSFGELIFDAGEPALHLQGQAPGRQLQIFDPPLALDCAILLKNARTQPSERSDRKQRRRSEQ